MLSRAERSANVQRLILAFLCFWLAPAAWLVLSPPISEPHRATPRTRLRLETLSDTLHAYVDEFKHAPSDLGALRAYAAVKGRPFHAYDAHGQRFDYLRLDESHFLVRSFGDDGEQNRERTDRDFGIINWGPRAAKNLAYRYTEPGQPHLFPAALLASADAPTGDWTAKLFVDAARGARQLLVRHKGQNGLFMVAPHDAVEEFLWLPDGKRLVFTASGSERHRDGLYVWDLTTDTQTTLTVVAETPRVAAPSGKGPTYWLSLGGIASVKGGAVVYVFSAPRTESGMSAVEFFSKPHLSALIVSETPGDYVQGDTPDLQGSLVGSPLSLAAHIGGSAGLQVQKAWLSLPLSGDMEKVLLEWHTYSERETQGPLFPYTLWILSTLYGESFAKMAERDARDADVLRTFGTEIARALLNYKLAPTYIRSLAIQTHDSLMDGQPLPSRMADLTATGVRAADLPQN